MGIGSKKIAGLLISAGSAQAIIAINIAQSLYPKYSVLQYLSDLGVGTTAPIFNFSLIILGILSIACAYYLKKSVKGWVFPVLLGAFGVFVAGVGLFPETTGLTHLLFAFLAFGDGGVLALLSTMLVKAPINYLFWALGLISLVFLLAGVIFHQDFGLGVGGAERMVAYPLFIWAMLFGGYMLAEKDK